MKQHIWLLALALLCIVGGIFGLTRQQQQEMQAAGGVEPLRPLTPEQRRLRAILDERTATPENQRRTPEDIIEEHRAAYDADPDAPDAPARLMAMANLYKDNLLDFRRAASIYEQLIIDYKAWDGVRGAFPQLITCYEQLNDEEGRRWVHLRMMEFFPEDTQEHLFARTALGL